MAIAKSLELLTAATSLAATDIMYVMQDPASTKTNRKCTITVLAAATDSASVAVRAVALGGTGRATSTTAYGLIAAGTTATGAHQTLAAGATTDILVGGGASALPVWTTATGSGAPVRATSPSLVTPTLGVASATSLACPTFTSAAGAMGFTPASGSNFNVTLATTGDFAVNTNQLYVDTSTGNVGFGTTSPGAINGVTFGSIGLHVSGKQYSVIDGSGTVGLIFNDSAEAADSRLWSINLRESNGLFCIGTLTDAGVTTQRLSLDRSGNVGIGTTTPNQRLTVEGTMSLKEQAAANADTAAYGQIWVQNATPNELYFTDDAGTDTQISPHPKDAPKQMYVGQEPGYAWIDKRVYKSKGEVVWLQPVVTKVIETFAEYNARNPHLPPLVKFDWDKREIKRRADSLKQVDAWQEKVNAAKAELAKPWWLRVKEKTKIEAKPKAHVIESNPLV